MAIFASGGGSNARAITQYFENHPFIRPALFLTNNFSSGVLELGRLQNIPVVVLGKSQTKDGKYLAGLLQFHKIDLVILAGYLKYIPAELLTSYQDRILNIHPSLLPKFGGKGMYGMNVHQAVIDAGEARSGMTVHKVNEVYDDGEIIFQAEVLIEKGWTALDLQKAVLTLEHKHFPKVIESVCNSLRRE
ncbi:MAG: phosphoribosylglycinamide formyltransferase [Bacteroidota bacterium]